MIPNFDNYLFRCSSLGKIMTEPRNKNNILSETTKSYLRECFISEIYGRKKEFSSKYTEKGNFVEEDAITLLSKSEGFLIKNKTRFQNEFVIGEPDSLANETVYDTKCSWDIFTFPIFDTEITNDDYDWQLDGYMWLTEKPKSKLCYCLINCPEHLIEEEEKRLYYRLKPADETSLEFQQEIKNLRKNLTFDDIPEEKRVIKFEKDFDNLRIEKLKNRIIECRKYLNSLSEIHFKTK